MKSALEHGLDPPRYRGKHTALEQDRERQILDWIKQSPEGSTAVTRKEIKDRCTSQFQVPITRGWVHLLVLRDPGEIIQAESSPQEEDRLQVSRVFLERTVQNLNEYVQGCIVERVFNLDELGISDWEDCKARKVVVSASRSMIRHQISRKVKLISVIACISVAGESPTPSIMPSQDYPSVREQLNNHGVRFAWQRI
jgi:hypothetical protein